MAALLALSVLSHLLLLAQIGLYAAGLSHQPARIDNAPGAPGEPTPSEVVMSAEAVGSGASHARVRTLTKDELRSLVIEWTGALKGGGLPPEKVLVAVGALVSDAFVPYVVRYVDADPNDCRHEVIVTDASQWCIEAYFNKSAL
jgi:hypothetical protein